MIVNNAMAKGPANIMNGVSTVMTLGIPQNKESLNKLTHAINMASEEIFNCRMNILQDTYTSAIKKLFRNLKRKTNVTTFKLLFPLYKFDISKSQHFEDNTTQFYSQFK